MSTREIVMPIIHETYGTATMANALACHLADKIDQYKIDPADERDNRERMIMLTCWDWMPGGSTAEAVANEITEALMLAGK